MSEFGLMVEAEVDDDMDSTDFVVAFDATDRLDATRECGTATGVAVTCAL